MPWKGLSRPPAELVVEPSGGDLHNMEYFKDFGVEHSLHDKIFINDDGYLETPTYKVPDCKFELKQPIQKVFTSKYDAIQRHKNKEKILVSAETYKNDYVLNIAV